MSKATEDIETMKEAVDASAQASSTTREKPKAQPKQSRVGQEQHDVEARGYVYIGPTLKNGAVRENQMFRGSLKQVQEHLAESVKQYPQLKLLIVDTAKLAESKKKLRMGDNALSHAYQAVAKAMQQK